MSSEQPESINCKVVLLGETGVGKTCLIERYTKSEFHDNFAPTLGGTFIEKEVGYKTYNKTIKFQIWDTAGQEKYRSINKLFYSDANIAILVYDITRKETFDEIKNYWYEQVKENAPKNIQMVIVGNKSDLYEFQEVPTEDVKQYAEEFGASAYECSAKTSVGVEEVFKKSGLRLINPNAGEVSFSELKQKEDLKKSVFISKPQSQTEEKKKRKAGCC